MTNKTTAASLVVLLVGASFHALAAGGAPIDMVAIVTATISMFGLFVIGTLIFSRENFGFSLRTFLLFFAVYSLFAGMARLNAEIFNPSLEVYQNLSDASTIYQLSISNIALGEELDWITDVGGAIHVYAVFYDFFRGLGLPISPSIGVLVNTFLAASGSVLGVMAVRKAYPGNEYLLRIAVFMFATSGLVFMFASLHLRDAFLYFCNAILLVLIVGLNRNPSLVSLIKTVVLSAAVVWLMTYFRRESSFILAAVIAALAFDSVVQRRRTMRGILLAGYVLVAATIAILLSAQFGEQFDQVRARYLLEWQGNAGLAYEFVVRAPMMLRIVFGTLYTIAANIPFMVGFFYDEWYYWFVSIQALQMLIVLPAFVFGGYRFIRDLAAQDSVSVQLSRVWIFYCVVAIVISSTTLGVRHLGQFLPFLYFLSARGLLEASRSYMIVSFMSLGVAVPLAWAWAKLL